MFLECEIILLEWFLKDHVTMKTGVMMLKIQHWITEMNYISKYNKIENSYFKFYFFFFLQYYCFYCIFDQIDAALVRLLSKK